MRPQSEKDTLKIDQPGLESVRNAVRNRRWLRFKRPETLRLPGGLAGLFRLPSSLSSIHQPSLGLAAVTLILAILLPRTRLSNTGRLIAVLSPTFLILLLGLDEVKLVRDIGDIPSGILAPAFPPLAAFTPEVITGAAAVAIIILVQSAGVSQSVPVTDGPPPKRSRDFIAVGLANMASGFFWGLPVGGSVSGTALNILYGAQTRWAAILAGLLMAIVVQFFSGAVGYIAMPALGAVLVLAGATSINPRDIKLVIENGWHARLAGITTFVSMLFFPIQAAVGFGVVLSAFLYVLRSASEITIVELLERENGAIEERHPPSSLPAGKVTVLDVYGHLFYAGAQTLDRILPRPDNATRAVVILRLRGQSSIGATLLDVLVKYSDELSAKGGKLFLSGLSPSVRRQITNSRFLSLNGPRQTFEATSMRGESTRRAIEESQLWLMESAKRERHA